MDGSKLLRVGIVLAFLCVPRVPCAAAEEAPRTWDPFSNFVKKVKFNGDLRLRHESQWRQRTGLDDNDEIQRHRERIRLRFGFDLGLTDDFSVGARLATGSLDDPVSTNQTLGGGFTNKPLNLDRAYVKWAPFDWGAVYGGRFKNFLFYDKAQFDGDINFDGLGQELSVSPTKDLTLFANFVEGPIAESGSIGDDPWLFVGQGGFQVKTGPVSFKGAAGMWAFNNVENEDITAIFPEDAIQGDNDTWVYRGTDALRHPYNILDIIGQVKIKPKGMEKFPITLDGHWWRNTATGSANYGYSFGATLGDSRGKKGTFYLKFQERYLQANSFPDVYTDSDFHGGGTNSRGEVYQMGYKIFDNLELANTFYYAKRISRRRSDGVDNRMRWQCDLVWTF